MSAYVVSDAHIRALITWAAMHRVSYYWQDARREVRGDAPRTASVLYAENVRSVNARYNDCESAHGFRYSFSAADIRREPVAILKACHGYMYQACEASGWEESEAHAIIRAIEGAAVRSLPGYDAAQWEISDEVSV